MAQDAVLNLRAPSHVKTALARAAQDNLRTMSSMAVWALAEWLSTNGYLEKTSAQPKKAAAARIRRK